MKKYSKDERHQIVSKSPFTQKEFTEHISKILGHEWNERYESRIKQFLYKTGTTTPSKEEEEAMNAWCFCQENPCLASQKMMDYEWIRSVSGIMYDYIKGRRLMNYVQANKILSRLKNLR